MVERGPVKLLSCILEDLAHGRFSVEVTVGDNAAVVASIARPVGREVGSV